MNQEYDVDIVVPWVDGSDPAWLAEKASYEGPIYDADGEKNSVKRYRDLNLMKYWFRGIENFAPWVRKIHFVTWGHLPEFLNIDHPRLHIVNHKEFIPSDCLPMYNANVIEVSLHRINDLAERFVYFNDDIFLLKPTKKEDFFYKGLPKINAVECPVFQDGVYGSFLKNDIDALNRNFVKKTQIKKNVKKWFSAKTLKGKMCNIFACPWEKYLGFIVEHGPMPYLKKTWLDVWNKEHALVRGTQMSRFRNYDNVNQNLFHFWQIANGDYEQGLLSQKMFVLSDESVDDVCSIVQQQKFQSVCINDGVVSDFENVCKKLDDAFESILSRKSSFER